MYHPGDRRGFGEDVGQMTPPAGRVFAFAPLMVLRVIQNTLHPSTQPCCGFGRVLPDRSQDSEHVFCLHAANRFLTEDGRDMPLQRAAPHGRRARVFPAGSLLGDVLLGNLCEGQVRNGLSLLPGFLFEGSIPTGWVYMRLSGFSGRHGF